MDIRWSEVRIGIFLLAALVFLGLGIFMVGQKTQFFAAKTKVQVILPNVQGLKVGAPVLLSGVVVGTVDEVAFTSPTRSDQVTVTLDIEASAAPRLGPDAKITVKTRGLLGEKYVDITPGGQPGPLPPTPLKGVSPMGMDEVITEAYSAFERLGRLVELVENGKGSLGRLLQDPSLYDDMVEMTRRLESLAAAASEGEGSLARLVKDPTLYKELVAFSSEGRKAADRLQKLAAALENPDGTLGRLAHDPGLFRESLQTVRRASSAMTELESLLKEVRTGNGTAGRLIREGELHQRLSETLENLNALVKDIREHPERYVQVSIF